MTGRSALLEQDSARVRIAGRRGFEAEAEVRVSPLGLLAIGGLVAAILLSVAPIIRAAGRARRDAATPPNPRQAAARLPGA